jgi:MHS family proline/betaine transporter-like MFS transporter
LGNRRGAGAALKLSMIGMAIPASLIAFFACLSNGRLSRDGAIDQLSLL